MMHTATARIECRYPSAADGETVWELVRDMGGLELNSAYSYIMMFDMFRATCCMAQDGERLAGFATAFRKPDSPDVLFVWQIGVAPAWRGKGIGKTMLHEILQRETNRNIRYVEATVGPNNGASRSLFKAMAEELGCGCAVSTKYGSELFPKSETHDDELLFRLGPIRS